MFVPSRPYNDLPPLPPSHDIETPAILKACTKAARALAELKGISQTLPAPDILLITLPLQEARSSSAIENIITTTSSLFKALALEEKDKDVDPHTKEVMLYRRAMEIGERELGEKGVLATGLFERICTALKGVDMQVRRVPGIRLENPATREVVYTPPEGEAHLRDLLGNLERFIHEDDRHEDDRPEDDRIDPLIKMAVMHYQFEAIHPFTDGNGRTGRILNILYLMQQGLLNQPVLYLSRYFINHREDYYDRLSGVTRSGAWEPWILYALAALETTAKQTCLTMEKIRSLFDRTLEKARDAAPNAHIKEMTELIFTRPYVQIRTVMRELEVSRLTATKYLRKWEESGLLSTQKVGREILFINDSLLDLFAEEEKAGA